MKGDIAQARFGRSRHFLISGFLLLAVIVALTVWFAARERADEATAQAMLLANDRLADLLSVVRQGEAGERGYLLTGKANYLRPYMLAAAAAPRDVRTLSDSVGAGADAGMLTMIQRLVETKFAELARTIGLYQAGDKTGALKLFNTDLDNRTMAKLHDVMMQMQSEQTTRLEAGQARDATDGWILQAATGLAVLATVLLALFAIRKNRLHTDELQAAEAALIEANLALERKVAARTRTLQASEAALADANARLERRVAERARELDRIYELSTDILIVAELSGRFLSVSPAWERITGSPAQMVQGRSMTDFVHPDDQERLRAALAQLVQGEAMAFESRCQRAHGTWCWLSWRAVALPDEGLMYCVARDITIERERDEQLRQSQKMEAVGQLTGGVAHDFNNLLTIIMGSLELLQRSLRNDDPRLLRRVEIAMDGSRRAAALTHRLLAFSRRQPLAPKAIDINRLIAGMSDMLHRTLGEVVTVEVAAAAGLWPALADANQLESALLNLAINARDAMQAGGRLIIETQNMYLDDVYAAAHADLQPGQYVQIAVTDSGCGMTEDVRAKVFEPFFTTKPQGQGTGLGLAQVYGFIKQSGGHVTIHSALDFGTTVKLYLPRPRREEAPSDPVAAAVQSYQAGSGHGETILVVEDEEGVRNFSIEILQELGYRVMAAANAPAALQLVKQALDFSLLFTDVGLPGQMDGRALANRVLEMRPDVSVLFTTGYTRNAIVQNGRLDDGTDFIGKPFTAVELAQKVQDLLATKTLKSEAV